MTDKVYSNEIEDPTWLLYHAYYYIKKYSEIPEFEVPPLRVGLAGRMRDLLRMWGNMNWTEEV
jgi:hypothetical protein